MNQNQIENIFALIYQIEPEITHEQYVEITIACVKLTIPKMNNEVNILYNSVVAKWNKEQLNGIDDYKNMASELADAANASYEAVNNSYGAAYAAGNAAYYAALSAAYYADAAFSAAAAASAAAVNADIISAIETVIPNIRFLITFS